MSCWRKKYSCFFGGIVFFLPLFCTKTIFLAELMLLFKESWGGSPSLLGGYDYIKWDVCKLSLFFIG